MHVFGRRHKAGRKAGRQPVMQAGTRRQTGRQAGRQAGWPNKMLSYLELASQPAS